MDVHLVRAIYTLATASPFTPCPADHRPGSTLLSRRITLRILTRRSGRGQCDGGLWRLGLIAATILALVGCAAVPVPPDSVCVAEGAWFDPHLGIQVADAALLTRLDGETYAHLGERHDDAGHHRWQAETIAALAARRPVAIGLEMLPRSAQGAIDRFLSGASDETRFLEESDWRRNWGFDFALYRPIFDVARARGLRVAAINVERRLVSAVGRGGWQALGAEDLALVGGRAAPPPPAYVARLRAVFEGHGHGAASKPDALDRFVAAQSVWDRAMASGLRDLRATLPPGGIALSIVGMGHLAEGGGVPFQLASLGEQRGAVLLPWVRSADGCRPDAPDALAVRGLAASRS